MQARRHSRTSIANQLARIQRELAALGDMIDGFDPHLPDASAADWISSLVRARRRRDAIFPDEGFGDPGWDMLLELYAAELGDGRMSISELGTAASVAPSTALRWVNQLEESGIVVRTPDAADKRRLFVSLSPKGLAAMREYFGQRKRG